MNKGILMFAHNSRDIDYASLSLIAGSLAKKNLNVPVSLVTDASTINWMKESNVIDYAESLFDKIIEVDRPGTSNSRIIHDGDNGKYVPFINQDRPNVYDLTPYDRTLMIDSDFLIFTDRLNQYWDADSDVMISDKFENIRNGEAGYLDANVSETGPKLYWATTVMFSKNNNSKIFFDLVRHVREHYKYYASVYRFSSSVYRNDIAFSIAKHIIDNFSTDVHNNLPPVFSVIDRDELVTVKDDGNLIFLLNSDLEPGVQRPASVKNLDIHIMNKQSILRHKDNLLGLI